jgi:hypothetical protein
VDRRDDRAVRRQGGLEALATRAVIPAWMPRRSVGHMQRSTRPLTGVVGGRRDVALATDG